MDSKAIMIVDDNESLSSAFGEALRGHGFRVLTAREGQRAAELSSELQDNLALALVDMHMPGLDGPTTIEAIYRASPDVKVIAISGCMLGPYFARLSQLGVRRFLPKPVEFDRLLTEVREALAVA